MKVKQIFKKLTILAESKRKLKEMSEEATNQIHKEFAEEGYEDIMEDLDERADCKIPVISNKNFQVSANIKKSVSTRFFQDARLRDLNLAKLNQTKKKKSERFIETKGEQSSKYARTSLNTRQGMASNREMKIDDYKTPFNILRRGKFNSDSTKDTSPNRKKEQTLKNKPLYFT